MTDKAGASQPRPEGLHGIVEGMDRHVTVAHGSIEHVEGPADFKEGISFRLQLCLGLCCGGGLESEILVQNLAIAVSPGNIWREDGVEDGGERGKVDVFGEEGEAVTGGE
jgi:hypothetical protein